MGVAVRHLIVELFREDSLKTQCIGLPQFVRVRLESEGDFRIKSEGHSLMIFFTLGIVVPLFPVDIQRFPFQCLPFNPTIAGLVDHQRTGKTWSTHT